MVAAGSVTLLSACRTATDPDAAAHRSHPMVGNYELAVAFDRRYPDFRRPGGSPTDATITGVVIVADTVEDGGRDRTFFPNVRYSGVLCHAAGACGAAEQFASVTSVFAPGNLLTLGWSSPDGVTTLRLEGTFAGDSIAGAASYQRGMVRYEGVFVARRQDRARTSTAAS